MVIHENKVCSFENGQLYTGPCCKEKASLISSEMTITVQYDIQHWRNTASREWLVMKFLHGILLSHSSFFASLQTAFRDELDKLPEVQNPTQDWGAETNRITSITFYQWYLIVGWARMIIVVLLNHLQCWKKEGIQPGQSEAKNTFYVRYIFKTALSWD